MGRRAQPILARLWARIRVQNNGCWEWAGQLDADGYGVITSQVNGKWRRVRVHRLAHDLFFNDERLHSKWVLHKCDNRKCCNPDHLRLGDHQQNMDDMKRRNRSPRACGESNGRSRLKENDVREIIRRARSGEQYKKIAAHYSVDPSHVSLIARGKMWKHIDV